MSGPNTYPATSYYRHEPVIVGSLMAKLFGYIMKSNIITWTSNMFNHAL